MSTDGPDLDRAAELKLIDAALLGDMEAFADLFERYRHRLYALCLKRLNDPSLAQDIVQEVFIRAFISLPDSDYRRPLWPWLATIASRMCIGLQRRRSYTDYSEDIEPAMEADANRRALDNGTDSPLDAVIAAEKRAELSQSLQVLSKRQRRVFLLHVLDEWSCSDIAAAEGISVGAVHLLLFRARRKLRSLRENGPLPAIVLPFSWLRWKFQRIEERIRPLLGVRTEGLSSACLQLVCLGALAIVVAGASHPAEPFAGNEAFSSDEAAVLSSQSPRLPAASPQTVSPNFDALTEAPTESQQSVGGPASSLVADVINPNQRATPENSFMDSIVSSPSYQTDHTILATGSFSPFLGPVYSSPARILFTSNDGGGSWKPLPSRLLFGSPVVPSPGYPQDKRLFALGVLGLQQSDDGGESFRMVSPLTGSSLAIPPSFGKGDSRVWISGKTILEYDADSGITRPASLQLPPSSGQAYLSIVFSPDYPADPTVFVADAGETFYRCEGLLCEKRVLVYGSPRLKLSPLFGQDGFAYALTAGKLFVSNDGVRKFQDVHIDNRGFTDLAILWNAASEPSLFAAAANSARIYRSLDGGGSWEFSTIDFPGFRYGAGHLILTATGRLLATGKAYGIACSVDGGQTWRPRCPPEP